jgi:hypothetical protein
MICVFSTCKLFFIVNEDFEFIDIELMSLSETFNWNNIHKQDINFIKRIFSTRNIFSC